MLQEARGRLRRVIRQICAQYAVAVERFAGSASGRRHVRQEHAMPGVTLKQRIDQRLRSAGFAERYRVQPDHRCGGLFGEIAEALGDMFAVTRLAPRAPGEPQPRVGQQEVRERCIKQAHQARASTALATTSCGLGGAAGPPRLRPKRPRIATTPVRTGSEPLNNATTGTPSAAARCASPESTPTASFAPANRPAASLRLICGAS